MTDQSNVFSNEEINQETPEQTQPQSGDYFSDQLKEIKAEDGRQKYGTVEEALKALAHSQEYIPTLKGQMTQQEQEIIKLREELAKRDGVQDVVEQLTKQQDGNREHHSEAPLDEQAIKNILESTLAQRESQAKAQTNTQKVVDALKTTYGDKVRDIIQAKAKELNTTPELIGQLAESSPDLVLTLFNTKQTTPGITQGSVHLGLKPKEEQTLQRPDKSLLSGSSIKDQTEYMRRVKEHVYKKFDITVD